LLEYLLAGSMSIDVGAAAVHGAAPHATKGDTAKDEVLLERVRVGDRIRFSMAEKNKRMVVTELEVAK
jgi:hypothetical protein